MPQLRKFIRIFRQTQRRHPYLRSYQKTARRWPAISTQTSPPRLLRLQPITLLFSKARPRRKLRVERRIPAAMAAKAEKASAIIEMTATTGSADGAMAAMRAPNRFKLDPGWVAMFVKCCS